VATYRYRRALSRPPWRINPLLSSYRKGLDSHLSAASIGARRHGSTSRQAVTHAATTINAYSDLTTASDKSFSESNREDASFSE
jgi:hypothetical protein